MQTKREWLQERVELLVREIKGAAVRGHVQGVTEFTAELAQLASWIAEDEVRETMGRLFVQRVREPKAKYVPTAMAKDFGL